MRGKDKKLANLMVAIHWLWIGLVVISLPLVVLSSGYVVVFPLIVAMFNFIGWLIWKDCPLLKAENYFRERHNPERVDKKMFLAYYLKKYVSQRITHRSVQFFEFIYLLVIILIAISKVI